MFDGNGNERQTVLIISYGTYGGIDRELGIDPVTHMGGRQTVCAG